MNHGAVSRGHGAVSRGHGAVSRGARALRTACFAGLGAAALFLSGCEQIFTYSPVASLRRPPSALSAEQQLEYARDAMASGDPVAMEAAYDLLKIQTTDSDAQYMAAQLGVELSGVSALLMGVVDGSVELTIGDPTDITNFLDDHPDLDPIYLMDAAEMMQNAEGRTEGLATMDYVIGSLGLALAAAKQPDGSFDFAAANLAEAENFAQGAQLDTEGLDPADPLFIFVDQYMGYLNGL